MYTHGFPRMPVPNILLVLQQVALIAFVLVFADGLSCNGGTVSAAQSLSSGVHTINNCVISAAITVSDAQLSVTGGSSTTSTGKITVGSGSTVSVINTTVGADLAVLGGTLTVSGSTFAGTGRVYGSGGGSCSISVSGSVFADTTSVTNQMNLDFGSGTQAVTITDNRYVGRGSTLFFTGTYSLLKFSSNDLRDLGRVAGTITTAVTFGTVKIPSAGVVELTSNTASSSRVYVLTAGGIALLNMGTFSSSAAAISVNVSANAGFVQIVSGASDISTGSACTTPLIFSGNSALIMEAPNTLAFLDFQVADIDGCPVQVSNNKAGIGHSTTSATSGLIALVSMSTAALSTMTVDGNMFIVSAVGAVNAMLIALSANGNFKGSLFVTGNSVTITTAGGFSCVLRYDGGASIYDGKLSITETTGTLTSSSGASVLQILAGTSLKIERVSTLSLSRNVLTLTAALRLLVPPLSDFS